jgi:organic hydroperoxide reductase OsmC/OhrA
VHRYAARCSWRGSTAGGYEAYDRNHRGKVGSVELELSADPVFLGRVELLNPEELLLLAASSCQLLSFLAVAARARLDVLAYDDRAEALMPDGLRPMRITEIHLRPTIRLGTQVSEERVRRLSDVAHRECFIAQSLRAEVSVEPSVFVDPGGS